MVIYKIIKKQVPQYIIFRCGMTHLNYSLKKIRKNFQITKRIIEKREMNLDGIDETDWKDKRGDWLPYVKNDVVCIAYSYAR